MTESPNNSRRRPSQARGLRSRNRTRGGDNQNNQQRQNNQQSRSPQANRQRKNDNAKNGAKSGQRRKPNRQRAPHNKLDSELDFRLSRPSSLQQQNKIHHEEAVLFSQTQVNGNGKGRGKSVRNGQQWTPSDGGIYLHELHGSEWYREDQARYAAKQIALENAEKRQADAERTPNGESTRRTPHKARNNRNQRQRQTNTNGVAAESDNPVKEPTTEAATTPPPTTVNGEEKQINGTVTIIEATAPSEKPKPTRKTATTGAAKKKVTRKRKPSNEEKNEDSE